MATKKQTKATRHNVTHAQEATTSKRTGTKTPKTRAELYEIAKKRDLPGRSKMRRDELAKKLGEK